MEQAKLGQEQVRSAKIANQHSRFDEDLYEKSKASQKLYDKEKARAAGMEQQRIDELMLARNNPANGDIWSGHALNVLLKTLQQIQGDQGMKGPSIPIPEEILRHINLTTGTAAGSVGAFRNPDHLSWPLVLRGNEFKEPKDQIDKLAPVATRQAASGSIEPDTFKKLSNAINSLTDLITSMAGDLSPTDYIQSKRFANNLSEGVKNLTEPNAVNYLNGHWAAKGGSISGLIDHMSANGLRFASAVEGDQPFYSSMYNLLREYDFKLDSLTGHKSGDIANILNPN